MQNKVEIIFQKNEKGTQSSVPFSSMKEKILGSKYELSVAFVSPAKMKKINTEYRGKDYVANILSFPYTKTSGEIFLCLSKISKESKDFDMTKLDFLKYLVIHGMLHLKGYDHGSTMDKMEEKLQKYFKIKTSKK